MAGYKDIDPHGGNKFSSTNQPLKNGRKPSIKKQLQELLETGGELKISNKDVVRIETNGDVLVSIPTEMQLAMKLFKIAMKGNNNTTLKAIQMIMEQVDGKPRQSVDVSNSKEPKDQIVIFEIPDNNREIRKTE